MSIKGFFSIPSSSSENPPVYYPLNQSQQLILFQYKCCPRKQIVNIPVEVHFTGPMQPRCLLNALHLVLEHHEGAAVRLHRQKDQSLVQYLSKEKPKAVHLEDYSMYNMNAYEKILAKWGGEPFPHGMMDVQLYRFHLLRRPDESYALFGVFSHAVFDAYAIIGLLQEVLQIYQLLIAHPGITKEELLRIHPIPTFNPFHAYQSDFDYIGSEKDQKDQEYYQNTVFSTEPQFTILSGKAGKAMIPGKRYGRIPLSLTLRGQGMDLPIDPEVIQCVQNYAQEHQVSPFSLYFMALRTYLAAVCEVDDVTILPLIARRSTLLQQEAGGTLVNTVPLRSMADFSLSFKDSATQMFLSLLQTLRHANCRCEQILNDLSKHYPSPMFTTYIGPSMTYQPYLKMDDSIPFEFRHIHNGVESMALYATIMPSNTKGDFIANYSFQPTLTSEQDVRRFHAFMQTFLLSGCQHPDKNMLQLVNECMPDR